MRERERYIERETDSEREGGGRDIWRGGLYICSESTSRKHTSHPPLYIFPSFPFLSLSCPLCRPELECRLPMRPDHGHKLLQDLKDPRTNPGYPAIGQ